MKIFHRFISAILIPALISIPVFAEAGEQPVSPSLQLHANVQGEAISVHVTDQDGAAVSDAAVLFRLPDAGVTGTFADGTHAAVAYTDLGGEARISGVTWSSGSGVVPVKITVTKGTARAGMLLEQQRGDLSVAAPRADAAVAAVKPVPEPGQVKSASPAVAAPQQSALVGPPAVPMVTISHGPTREKISGGSHKKWIILAAVVGAGAGAAFALAGKKSSSSSSSSSTSTTSIGSPTISVGAP